MEKNILSNKNMEEVLRNKNKELLKELDKINNELLETKEKLSTTELLLKELREERELAERRHKETIERLERDAKEAAQRHLTQVNELRASTSRIINSVKKNVKSNIDGTISKQPENNQKEVLRLFINREDLSSTDKIIIKVNRCQLKYLKKLESNEIQLGKLLNIPNAMSTLNKFIETSSIEMVRLTSNKLQINIDHLELFQEEFEKFVINSQNLNELEIISEEIDKEIDYELTRYENLLKHLYFLEGAYRALTYNSTINKLQYHIKTGDRIVTINNIQNTLQNKSCNLIKMSRRYAQNRFCNKI